MGEWAYDLGGSTGFGAVEREQDEPVFHADWERRVFGMTAIAALGEHWSTNEFRHAVERMDPGWYLDSSYYEHWLAALSTLLVEKGLVPREQLAELPLSRPADPAAKDPIDPPPTMEPFETGQRVRVREFETDGHTRCPHYIRGRTGVVVRHDGEYVVPDVDAHTDASPAEPTYSVRFDAAELWGEDAEPGASVAVDLWHRYLESVE